MKTRSIPFVFVALMVAVALLLALAIKIALYDLKSSGADHAAIIQVGEWLFLQSTSVGRVFDVLSLAYVVAAVAIILYRPLRLWMRITIAVILIAFPVWLEFLFLLRTLATA